MRFLRTKTLQFVEISDSEVRLEKNKYAILSHRWGAAEDEVTFDDILSGANVTDKKGFAKLKSFCEKASERGLHYGWADTCCVDKRSSSELSEAIRSMYHWYEGSSCCVAYLEDVPKKDMTDSEWFKRGWTLQELISPKDVSFFDHDWNFIGTKRGLLATLSLKTKIPEDILGHVSKPSTCSVAQRMSWASGRDTTRVEDRAYSLLGLFGVSLTPNYGEREQAFLRLQQAIVLGSKDESIFAWDMDNGDNAKIYSGLYAPSPCSFADCSRVHSTQGSSGFTEANGELSIRLRTYPYRMESYFAVLNCAEAGRSDDRNAILITRLPDDDEYVRVRNSHGISRMSLPQWKRDDLKERQIRVPVNPVEPPLSVFDGFWLRTLKPPGHDLCQPAILSRGRTSTRDHICLDEYDHGTAGIVQLQPKNPSDKFGWSKIRWIKFGFDKEYNPVILLANGSVQNSAFEELSSLYRPTQILFEQAVESGPGLQAHEQIMANSWITAEAGIPDRKYGWPTGVSILQADRKKGISYDIAALNLHVSIRLLPQSTPSIEQRDPSGLLLCPTQIWAVDITDIGGTSPEHDHRNADFGLYLGSIVTLFFCLCSAQIVVQKRKKRHEARIRKGRLGGDGNGEGMS